MPKTKESAFDAIAAMPWPLGIAAGVVSFILVRYVIAGLFISSGNLFLKPLGEQLAHGAGAWLAWIVLIVCWIAAAVSFFRQHERKQLLETRTGLDSLLSMSWREFEMLVGEAFRRQGYAVEETGLGGADGGIDLILRKNQRIELVQCKQWRTRQVKVNVVREMAGLLGHHRADAVKIVCVGEFTPDAKEFASGKAIELINGETLLQLVRDVQTSAPPAQRPSPRVGANAPSPSCPMCGATMVRRIAKNSNKAFWGCSNYPKCRGTRDITR